jgi:hypothetical protein
VNDDVPSWENNFAIESVCVVCRFYHSCHNCFDPQTVVRKLAAPVGRSAPLVVRIVEIVAPSEELVGHLVEVVELYDQDG